MFEFLEKLYEEGIAVEVSLSFNKHRKRVEGLINEYESFSKTQKELPKKVVPKIFSKEDIEKKFTFKKNHEGASKEIETPFVKTMAASKQKKIKFNKTKIEFELDTSKIYCLEEGCGKAFKILPNHLKKVHGMTVAEYKSKHGQDAQIVCEDVKKKNAKSGKKGGYSRRSK